MSEVFISKKWAEMIKELCQPQNGCFSCQYKRTCDAACMEDVNEPPYRWDLNVMQDEAYDARFHGYEE